MSKKHTIENKVEAYLDTDDSPDISNPIHSTEIANAYGFEGPLVGGTTVWGWATDTILEAVGQNWLDIGWSEHYFRRPTFPGDILTIKATLDDDVSDYWNLQMINQKGDLCVVGKFGEGKGPWLAKMTRPKDMNPVQNYPMDILDLENVQIDIDWKPMEMKFSREISIEFTSTKQLTKNPLFLADSTSEKTIAHPSWAAGWPEQLLRHNFQIPNSIHTMSWIQHYAKIPIGTSLIGGAHIVDAYEKKSHHFVNFDVLIQDKQGRDISQMRHWTIFRVATPEERH